VLYTELSRSPPHRGQFFSSVRPHLSQCHDRTTPGRHSATFFRNHTHNAETSRADHCRASCCLHQIPGRVNDRCNPATAIKGEALLPRTAGTKASYLSKLGITTSLVVPPASLGHPATSPSIPSVPSLAKQAVHPSSTATSRRSSEVDRRKDSSQANTHDSVLGIVRVIRWTLIGMYLYIVGRICLLLVVHVHILRPLPHEWR
jgi:hypothetical protein